jgi:hypothetical protein
MKESALKKSTAPPDQGQEHRQNNISTRDFFREVEPEQLAHVMTDGLLVPAAAISWLPSDWADFSKVCADAVDVCGDWVFFDRRGLAGIMNEVVSLCHERMQKYPRGWLKIRATLAKGGAIKLVREKPEPETYTPDSDAMWEEIRRFVARRDALIERNDRDAVNRLKSPNTLLKNSTEEKSKAVC